MNTFKYKTSLVALLVSSAFATIANAATVEENAAYC